MKDILPSEETDSEATIQKIDCEDPSTTEPASRKKKNKDKTLESKEGAIQFLTIKKQCPCSEAMALPHHRYTVHHEMEVLHQKIISLNSVE